MSATTFAEMFPVGEHLAEELEARGWTQIDFAEVLGRPAQVVSEIVAGKKEITRESAAQIGAALGTSAELWLNLQDTYHLWLQGLDPRKKSELEDVRLRAQLKVLAPVAILRKRGYLKESSPQGQLREIMHLYRMQDVDDDPCPVIAARRSNPQEELTPTQVAWVACVKARAATVTVETYSEEGLRQLAERTTRELRNVRRFESLPAEFAAVGVRLVFVESFPSSKLDGCSFLMDGVPVIGISGRGKRLDKVLYTLLHEIAHILLGHLAEGGLIVDEDSEERHTLDIEEQADDQARRWILPKPLPSVPERVSVGWVQKVADEQGVHPIVVIGRLQKERKLSWRTALVKGAPNVTDQLSSW